jgi:hypothetical protein
LNRTERALRPDEPEFMAFEPKIKPSAKYSIPMAKAKVGETQSIKVSHYVEAHGVDRIKIALHTTRNLALRLTLHYNKGQKVEQMFPDT